MDSALNPREIQSRIRAGESVEEVARSAGVPVDEVDAFATPVLAERRHQASSALASHVRRRGETGSSRALEAVVGDRLLSQGIDPDGVAWDAWRGDNRIWTVQGRYRADDVEHEVVFHFDPRARFSTAANEEARALIGEASPAQQPSPGRRRPGADPDAEPTVDLNDEKALQRAAADAAEMTVPLPHQHATPAAPTPPPGDGDQAAPGNVDDYLDTELEQVDGVYDFVPSSHSQLDTLYDMLSSFNEDSVNIYAGLDAPPSPGSARQDAGRRPDHRPAPAGPQAEPDTAPDEQASAESPAAERSEPASPRTPAAPGRDRAPDARGVPATGGQDALVEEPGGADADQAPAAPAKPKRRKRASVPTWDEIMFGGPGPRRP